MSDKTRAELLQELTALQDRLERDSQAIAVQRKARAEFEDRVAELEEALAESRREIELLRRSSRSMARLGHRSEQEAARREDLCNLVRYCGSDLLLRVNRAGKIKDSSPAAAELVGHAPEELVGRRLEDFLEKADKLALRNFLQSLEEVPGTWRLEVGFRLKDGSRRPLTLFGKASPHPQTQEREAVILVRMREPGSSWDAGAVADRQLASFFAHELNQPLTAIGTLASALQRGMATGLLDEKDRREGLEEIARQATRGSNMIQRLRALAAREPVRFARVEPAEVILSALRQLESLLRERSVRVDLDLGAELPPVPGDLLQLEQVLINLVRNAAEALDHVPVPERVIEIKARSAGERLRISVRDRGPGISPERASTLFQPFRTTKANGLGLGLALCRIIIEAHRGELIYEPAEDRGAIFSLDLPTVSQHEHHHPSERLPGR